MRSKSPGQLNTRCIRISLALYNVLKQRAALHDTSMTDEADKLAGMEKPQQAEFIAMPHSPVFRVMPITTFAVNGAGIQHSAFVVKPKGGIIHGTDKD